MTAGDTSRPHPAALAPLLAGVAALVVGTLFGWDARVVDAVVAPPPVVRAALVATAVVLGGALLVAGLRRMGSGSTGATATAPDLPTMVRGVRLLFLALAAFAAAAGWILGHPLPIVVALIIAGVDIVETSFLLLVVGARGAR